MLRTTPLVKQKPDSKAKSHSDPAIVKEFLDDSAMEEDEELQFGWGDVSKSANNQESDDEAPDTVVEGLLDDSQLGEEHHKTDKILEKY